MHLRVTLVEVFLSCLVLLANRQSVIQNKVSVGIVLLRGLSDLEEKHPSLRELH